MLGSSGRAASGSTVAYTSQQYFATATLTSSAASIAWDVGVAQQAEYTATENTTLANPTNMVNGAVYQLRHIQHASAAKTLAFDTAYRPAALMPAVSTAANAVDIFTFRSNGTVMELIGFAQNVGT